MKAKIEFAPSLKALAVLLAVLSTGACASRGSPQLAKTDLERPVYVNEPTRKAAGEALLALPGGSPLRTYADACIVDRNRYISVWEQVSGNTFPQ